MPTRQRPRPSAGETFDAFAAAADGSAEIPVLEARRARARRRRGGPRTPLPLLPLIATVAGIGIAYVAQTAHVTQATYEATSLDAQYSQLRQEDQRLGDQLARLSSAARIDAAAQQLGMRPPSHWSAVYAVPDTIVVPGAPGQDGAPGGSDAVQRLVAALSGSFGPTEAEAAGR